MYASYLQMKLLIIHNKQTKSLPDDHKREFSKRAYQIQYSQSYNKSVDGSSEIFMSSVSQH